MAALVEGLACVRYPWHACEDVLGSLDDFMETHWMEISSLSTFYRGTLSAFYFIISRLRVFSCQVVWSTQLNNVPIVSWKSFNCTILLKLLPRPKWWNLKIIMMRSVQELIITFSSIYCHCLGSTISGVEYSTPNLYAHYLFSTSSICPFFYWWTIVGYGIFHTIYSKLR